MTPDPDNVTVVYTVKELLSRIDSKLDTFAVQLDAKASQELVSDNRRRIEMLELNQATNASKAEVQSAANNVKRFWVGLAVSGAIGLASLALNLAP